MDYNFIFDYSRFKLAITYAGVMGATLLICGYGAHIVMVKAFTRTIDRELEVLGRIFEDKLKPQLHIPGVLPFNIKNSLPEICFKKQSCAEINSESSVMSLLSDGHYVRLLNLNGEAIAAFYNSPDEFPNNIDLNYSYDITNRQSELYHLHLMPLVIHDNQLWGYLQVGRSIQRLNHYMNSLHWLLGLGIPFSMIIIGGAGWWLAGLAMQPIEKSYQQLQKFTADAAHELRTPISSLQTIVETNSIQPETKQALQRQINRLIILTQDLLLLSRLESGLQEAKWQQICLNDLVEVVEEELMPMAMEAEVILSSNIPEKYYVYIQGNESQIYRLLLNLVNNGIKYTPMGGEVKINLSANGYQGIMTITDTGIGIPAADIPHIFERFYRVNTDRSRKTGGSGLGLAIALAIVQMHKGKLEVESRVDIGTIFTVILPLVSKVNN
ncbi:two-component sensor histidine kinase [Sphaerospermopsis aphanizomenoides BCCUSP55]|uniref:two-component system sensor histidine kinase RppB n=1 Tax=Sphaerospermopsis aphanizomenoides TaxID=459663 RepID=UPI0019051EE9|nr:two-component system sensor histidine kinase RppB [Sphaerospermopsis aphanizomenoides]MBK1987167.1 two-component sensor histidine kinase [Sphaerospermopsis aphanizomenoides BCCUSP55]